MNYRQHYAMIEKYKKEWLKAYRSIPNNSGIYVLYRYEDKFKYAYIGQSKHILQRLAEHFLGYQHIDISLRKRGLYNENKNPNGWQLKWFEMPESELDKAEQQYIEDYNEIGYQLRYNKTGGGQYDKKGFEQEQTNGYYKGVDYGKKTMLNQIKIFFDKYLDVVIKEPNNKIKERKLKEFKELINGEFKK